MQRSFSYGPLNFWLNHHIKSADGRRTVTALRDAGRQPTFIKAVEMARRELTRCIHKQGQDGRILLSLARAAIGACRRTADRIIAALATVRLPSGVAQVCIEGDYLVYTDFWVACGREMAIRGAVNKVVDRDRKRRQRGSALAADCHDDPLEIRAEIEKSLLASDVRLERTTSVLHRAEPPAEKKKAENTSAPIPARPVDNSRTQLRPIDEVLAGLSPVFRAKFALAETVARDSTATSEAAYAELTQQRRSGACQTSRGWDSDVARQLRIWGWREEQWTGPVPSFRHQQKMLACVRAGGRGIKNPCAAFNAGLRRFQTGQWWCSDSPFKRAQP